MDLPASLINLGQQQQYFDYFTTTFAIFFVNIVIDYVARAFFLLKFVQIR